MARQALIVGIVIIVVALIGTGVVTLMSTKPNQPAVSPSPSPTPSTSLAPTLSPATGVSPTPNILNQEEIRDAAMTYIENRHGETAPLMANLSWTGGRQDTGLLGSETYLYNSTGWTVKIQYPVIPNPTYNITADYSMGNVSVAWEGRCQDGVIVEISYNATNLAVPLSTQEQVRDDVMNFIKTNHTETAVYIQNLAWTGGRATPEGLVGSETYIYLSGTWNVTMQNPVVPNITFATYTVTANCKIQGAQEGVFKNVVAWQGTWQNREIAETSYNFTP